MVPLGSGIVSCYLHLMFLDMVPGSILFHGSFGSKTLKKLKQSIQMKEMRKTEK